MTLEPPTRPRTYTNPQGQRVVVSPVDGRGARYDLEWLRADSSVRSYSPSVTWAETQRILRDGGYRAHTARTS